MIINPCVMLTGPAPGHLPQSNTAVCEDTADLLGIRAARRCCQQARFIRKALLLLTDAFFMNTLSSVLEGGDGK